MSCRYRLCRFIWQATNTKAAICLTNMFWKGKLNLITYQDEIIEKKVTASTDNGVEKKYLLTAAPMARFVTDGFLMVENIVADQLNEAVVRDEKSGIPGQLFWKESESIRAVFELP